MDGSTSYFMGMDKNSFKLEPLSLFVDLPTCEYIAVARKEKVLCHDRLPRFFVALTHTAIMGILFLVRVAHELKLYLNTGNVLVSTGGLT